MNVWDVLLSEDEAALKPVIAPDLLGGIVTLQGPALAQKTKYRNHGVPVRRNEALYFPAHHLIPSDVRPVEITAIPYYAWANREPGAMQVWIPME